MAGTFQISPVPLTLDIIEKILREKPKLALSGTAQQLIGNCRNYLEQKTSNSTEPLYGITTGFGSLCNRSIAPDQLEKLQHNLVVSHACGLGDVVEADVVRLMLLLKSHALSLGHSGTQLSTVERLLDFFNEDALPEVRTLGSLGASGDLAPLAHLVLPALGLGKVLQGGKWMEGNQYLAMKGLNPLRLQSKEGLALLNGTQFMGAHAVLGLLHIRRLIHVADVIAAISIEAYNGRIDPFLPYIHSVRPHPGQIETAANLRHILEGSQLISSQPKAVQDPYSFRCIPQVYGAVKDTFRHTEEVVMREINSVTDNPTLFPEEDLILSGGNFHGEPLAFVLDFMSIALAELGNMSERRVYRLISGQRGLPEFLVKHPGLNSGFMIPQYAAASVVSQNKQLCTPSSVDSITSSNEQEDHVSMGANAATKFLRVIYNVERILAIEMMTACQALDFRDRGKTSPYLQEVTDAFRNQVPFVDDDTLMADLIDGSIRFVKNFAHPQPI